MKFPMRAAKKTISVSTGGTGRGKDIGYGISDMGVRKAEGRILGISMTNFDTEKVTKNSFDEGFVEIYKIIKQMLLPNCHIVSLKFR